MGASTSRPPPVQEPSGSNLKGGGSVSSSSGSGGTKNIKNMQAYNAQLNDRVDFEHRNYYPDLSKDQVRQNIINTDRMNAEIQSKSLKTLGGGTVNGYFITGNSNFNRERRFTDVNTCRVYCKYDPQCEAISTIGAYCYNLVNDDIYPDAMKYSTVQYGMQDNGATIEYKPGKYQPPPPRR
jgi:hypothetical protein